MKSFPEYKDIRVITETLTHTLIKAVEIETSEPVIIIALNLFTSEPEDAERFRHEHQTMVHLDLDGVITPSKLVETDTYLYTVFPSFDDVLLSHHLLRHGKLELDEALSVAMSLIGVIGELHSARKLLGYLHLNAVLYSPQSRRIRLLSLCLEEPASRHALSMTSTYFTEFALPYVSPEMISGSAGLDHRSDFFTLGVLCYQLLTGQPPFSGANADQLIQQITKSEPTPIADFNPAIPAPVVEIIAKLLRKKPAERYQSVWGINADLERAYDQYQSTGRIASFKLGENDVNSTFSLPRTLYGRSSETKQLTELLRRVEKGGRELCFVRGFSGIGKTELIKRVFENQPRLCFCLARFDSVQKDRAYSVVLNAFRTKIRQAITMPAEVNRLREKLNEAVEGNGQLLVELLPDLEFFLGSQASPPNLHSAENQQRFNRLFTRFVAVFAQEKEPLVLFLDDLQWADTGALNLIETLLTDTRLNSFLFVGAYRDNEISESHPLSELIKRLNAQKIEFNDFQLQPLNNAEIVDYLRDTFASQESDLIPFARLVEEKTAGNPFFIAEFLKVLNQESLVFFDPEQARWCWDLAEIQSKDIPVTLVDFLTGKISRLHTETQQALMLATCLGREFDLFTLAMVSGSTLARTYELLQEALNEGVLITVDSSDEPAELNVLTDVNQEHVTYQFRHNRIRQAITSLIFKDSRPAIHLKVGRLLLKGADDDSLLDEHVFDVVDHLNIADSLITESAERLRLCELNRRAGYKAEMTLAYQSALNYYEKAIDFLPKKAWKKQYELSFSIYVDLIRAAFLANDYETMEHRVKQIEENARSLIELLPVYEIVIHSLNVRKKPNEAVDLIFRCAEMLGFNLPKQTPGFVRRKVTVLRYRRTIAKKTPEFILALSPMKDSNRQALIKIVVRYSSALYIVNPKLFSMLAYRMVIWQLQEGLTPESALSFASLGVYYSGTLKDFDHASFLGDIALRLLERPTSKALKARVLMLVSAYILPWVRSATDVIKPLAQAGQLALEIGDFGMALFALTEQIYIEYSVGRSLPELERKIATHRSDILRLGKQIQFHYFCQLEQFLHNLSYDTDTPCRLVGDYYDEDQEMSSQQANEDKNAQFSLNHFKLILNYQFGYYDEALISAQKNREFMRLVTGWYGVVEFFFYEALACCALMTNESDSQKKKELMARVTENVEQIRRWSSHAALNHENKISLLQAELHRLSGNESSAVKCYAESIHFARERDGVDEQAIATELAACFYYRVGKRQMASDYMADAISLNEAWGALPKAKELARRHDSWLR